MDEPLTQKILCSLLPLVLYLVGYMLIFLHDRLTTRMVERQTSYKTNKELKEIKTRKRDLRDFRKVQDDLEC